jgi:hypothetical protein
MRVTPRMWSITVPLFLLGTLFILAACTGRAAGVPPAPTASDDDITLTLDHTSYTTHQPFGITVTNNSKISYYARDGLSGCTYLQLEWYDPGKKAWVPVFGCSSVNPPQARPLAPASSLPFTLAPGDAPNDTNSWVAGLYRVSLRYGSAADGSGTLKTAYSAGFQVKG